MLEATPTGFFKQKRVAFYDSFRLEDNQTLFLVSNGRELTDEICEYIWIKMDNSLGMEEKTHRATHTLTRRRRKRTHE